MKKILIICISLVTVVHAQVKKTTTAKTSTTKTVTSKTTVPVLKNSLDSFSYAMGLQGAAYYKAQGVSKMNTVFLKKGFDDGYENKAPLLTPQQCNAIIQTTMQANMSVQDKELSKAANSMKEEGRKFLAENKKRPGVIELPSGLQYEIIKQGTGPKPKEIDTVKANYALSLINGQELQSSFKTGQPLVIPVNRVIPGWVEALQLMPVGSRWKLYIPSNLGYGDRGAGDAIPGGATLVFDIELLDIVNQSK